MPAVSPGLCALSINNDNCYLAYPGSAAIGEVQVFDTINLVRLRGARGLSERACAHRAGGEALASVARGVLPAGPVPARRPSVSSPG